MDPKGRIAIPARFREIIDASGGQVVLTGVDGAVYAYTPDQWAVVEAKVLGMGETTLKMRRFRRALIGMATICSCDRQSRLLIPQMLRQYASLKKDIVQLGQLTHFEVWAKDRYEADQDQLAADIDSPELGPLIDKLAF